jgi:hypothetical protein
MESADRTQFSSATPFAPADDGSWHSKRQIISTEHLTKIEE